MWVCATFASDARMTPSSIRLVYPAMLFAFNWCRSNRSVPEHRQRSLLGLRCQLVINSRNHFPSEIPFSCRYVVSETLFQTTCCLLIVFRPWSQRGEHRWAAWYLSFRDSWCRRKRLQCEVHLGRSMELRMLPPSCSRLPHVRLIVLDCAFASSVDRSCNWHQVCSRWQPPFS